MREDGERDGERGGDGNVEETVAKAEMRMNLE